MASYPWDSDFGGDDWKDLASQFIDPSTISQSQTAIEQRHKAKELEKNNIRPTYNIPASEQEALALARSQAAQTRLPGQSAIEGRLDQTTANQVSMLERLGLGGPDIINGASRAYGMQQQAENQLGVAAAQYHSNNQQILRQQLGINADYQDKEWDWNNRLPYDQNRALMMALQGASMQNSNEAWNSSVGGIKDFFSNYYTYGHGSNSQSKGGGATGMGSTAGAGYDSNPSQQNVMDRYDNPMWA